MVSINYLKVTKEYDFPLHLLCELFLNTKLIIKNSIVRCSAKEYKSLLFRRNKNL